MLQFLNISNIALIDDMQVEFESGLNLLTGETGSGKSIIVDALGVLIGGRFTNELLKSGAERGSIEGLFSVTSNAELEGLLENAGLATTSELIIRREISSTGRNKIFINNQLATHALLRDLRPFLVDIHGQGDQQTLFNPETHLELLDAFAGHGSLRDDVAEAYQRWSSLRRELDSLRHDEAEKFQLVDTLKFQIAELERAQLSIGEDDRLDEERRRLANVEKLTALCQSSYSRIYEDDDAALTRVRQSLKEVEELAEYESSFKDYIEGLESARALLEDLSFSLRDFADRLEFSPARLAEIEDRFAELSRLKRGIRRKKLEDLLRFGSLLQFREHQHLVGVCVVDARLTGRDAFARDHDRLHTLQERVVAIDARRRRDHDPSSAEIHGDDGPGGARHARPERAEQQPSDERSKEKTHDSFVCRG